MSLHADGRKSMGSTKVHIESGENDLVLPVRITGQPIGTDGSAFTQPIKFADGPNLDAFARLRVSQPTGLFDSQQQYDDNHIVWQTKVTNNSGNAVAAHDADLAAVNMTVDANDNIIRQTRQYFRYQPGKSQFILIYLSVVLAYQGCTPNKSPRCLLEDIGNSRVLEGSPQFGVFHIYPETTSQQVLILKEIL